MSIIILICQNMELVGPVQQKIKLPLPSVFILKTILEQVCYLDVFYDKAIV